jgi:hypothetical protein
LRADQGFAFTVSVFILREYENNYLHLALFLKGFPTKNRDNGYQPFALYSEN